MAVRTLEEVMSSPQQDNSTFFEAVVTNNPFAMNRVSDPSQMECDVPAIHAAEFTRLTEGADEALRDETGRGALLLGMLAPVKAMCSLDSAVGQPIVKLALCICITFKCGPTI